MKHQSVFARGGEAMKLLCLDCSGNIVYPEYPGEKERNFWLETERKCNLCGKKWMIKELI